MEVYNLREWQTKNTRGIYTHTPVPHRKPSVKKKYKATSAVSYINSQSALYTQTRSIN